MESRASSTSDIREDIDASGISAMIYVVDNDLKVKYVNEATADKFHCRACDLIGSSALELFEKLESENGKQNLMKVMSSGKPHQSTTRVTFPAGEKTLSTILIPIKDADGDVREIMGASYDMTSQRERDMMIRNKMEVILGYSGMLEDLIDDDETRELVERIIDAGTEIKQRLDSHRFE